MQRCTSSALLALSAIVVLWLQADAIFLGFRPFFSSQSRRPGLCFNCRCGRANNLRFKRLVGGSNVSQAEDPWKAILYLTSNGNTTIRTGAVISRNHILTAASAINQYSINDIRVGLGTENSCTGSSGATYDISQISYSPDGDLAVLTLTMGLTFNGRVQPICLPPFSTSSYQNSVAKVVSWGSNTTGTNATTPCVARQLSLAISPPSTCSSSGSTDTGCIGSVGTQSLICPTDAGGLVLFNTIFSLLIGIIPSSNECNNTSGPSAFTRTAPHLTWILETTSDSCYCTAY